MSTFALVGPVSPNLTHFSQHDFDEVVAVDGGYQHLVDAGLTCDFCVGDFDSLGYVPADVPQVRLPTHKDQTDTEEALCYCMSKGADEVYVNGTLGGRIDHTLAFLQLLGEFGARGLRVTAIGDDQAIIPLWGEGRRQVVVKGEPQGTFSLLALSDVVAGVWEEGVEYELEDAQLFNACPLGISNEFLGKPARIALSRGSALLFVPLHVLGSVS